MAERVEYILSIKDLFSGAIRKAKTEVDGLEKSLGSASGIGSRLTGILTGIGAALGAREILDSTAKIESLNNSIKFISGTSQEADKNFSFLKSTTDTLGTSLLSATAGFKTIAGAARGTSLEGEATRQAFLGISQASAKMGLSGEQSEGALLALGQMISKGKVQAEELRGQLGERIPGAFQIAARAMGMTTQALDKFMSDGKLMAEDFIPKFSAQLQKEFGGAMPESIQTTMNRFENLKTELMTSLIPAVNSILKTLFTFTTFLRENATEVQTLTIFIGGIIVATKAWAFAQALLNASFAVSPLGLIVVGVMALGAAFYYAWQKCDKFRYTIAGIWQVIKDIAVPLAQVIGGFALFHVNPQAGINMMKKGLIGAKNFSMKESFDRGYGLKEQSEYFEKNKATGKGSESGLGAYSPNSIVPTSLGTSAGGGSGGGVHGTSGAKPTTINITINKLVEKVEIHATTLTASTAKMVDEVKKALLTAVNDAQIIGN